MFRPVAGVLVNSKLFWRKNRDRASAIMGAEIGELCF